MASFLIVQKDGNIKETAVKNMKEDELYKKAGFRSADGFKLHASWTVENVNNKTYSIQVYGKTDGKANQENKYEFPPPIDNTLFFGSCLILNKNGEQMDNLTTSEWDAIYDKLYGGFEDLNSDGESESDDEEDDVPRTKSGYVKDGFIVDDDDEQDGEEEDEDEEEEEEEDENEDDDIAKPKRKLGKRIKKPIKKVTKNSSKLIPTTVFKLPDTPLENTLDCTHELCEEDYIEE
jgi:hypothetical protein